MKTKPVLKVLPVVIFIAAAFLLIKCRTSQKAQTSEVGAFLTLFNKSLQTGNTDSVLRYFDSGKQVPEFRRMANLLMGRQELKGTEKPLAAIQLDMDGAAINVSNDGAAIAKIPAALSHDSIAGKKSWLALTIHAIKQHQYKISKVDAKQFLTDYSAYENLVKSKTLSDKDLFSPETLAAFKTAEILKKTYDTVVWFAHMENKTYFYVAKGPLKLMSEYGGRDTVRSNNMGLLSPDLKEIIPPQYDLIHNISGTFPGLVEVEKNGKRGFYDLSGKILLPVDYDQVFPLENDENLAVLRNGNDYFYLGKDMAVSGKKDLKVSDFFSKIKDISAPLNLYKRALAVVTEYNSKEDNGAVYITPSYLADLNFAPVSIDFKNPLRKNITDEVHLDFNIKKAEKTEGDNLFTAAFYSIRDYFLGGRSEFYDSKNLLVVDKKNNRTYTQTIGTNYTEGDSGDGADASCDLNSIRALNDSLFEVKAAASLSVPLYDSTKDIVTGPYYHYLVIKNNKLEELNNGRNFGFTKYVKMDDSYLQGCYVMLVGKGTYDTRKKQIVNTVTPEMLRYMKNEIFADYRYQFKDKRWREVFFNNVAYDADGKEKPGNVNVDDLLTVIDKYNINWINQRLNGGKAPKNTIAAR